MTSTLQPLMPAKRGRGTAVALKHFADLLKRTPSEWKPYPFILTNSSALAAARKIRKGSVAFPAGEFEVENRGGQLWVRAIA